MKMILIAAVVLGACAPAQLERTVELTKEGCRAYLDVNPEAPGKFADGCRMLLHVKSA